jgi:hypothetical protein
MANKADNPNAKALVEAFKQADRDMDAWRKEAAPKVEALKNDLKQAGEFWWDGKRYTSIKVWAQPALGIKYRAMQYRLTGGNPVANRKKGATVAPDGVRLIHVKDGERVQVKYPNGDIWELKPPSMIPVPKKPSNSKRARMRRASPRLYGEPMQFMPKPKKSHAIDPNRPSGRTYCGKHAVKLSEDGKEPSCKVCAEKWRRDKMAAEIKAMGPTAYMEKKLNEALHAPMKGTHKTYCGRNWTVGMLAKTAEEVTCPRCIRKLEEEEETKCQPADMGTEELTKAIAATVDGSND